MKQHSVSKYAPALSLTVRTSKKPRSLAALRDFLRRIPYMKNLLLLIFHCCVLYIVSFRLRVTPKLPPLVHHYSQKAVIR